MNNRAWIKIFCRDLVVRAVEDPIVEALRDGYARTCKNHFGLRRIFDDEGGYLKGVVRTLATRRRIRV